ncbi:MAG: phosphomannomutase/phosphoglucomutase [Oscillospiraceae bacterium]|nr:phosphomannomutase/phosphoglucomutase [Oscillospiraceae bacterium]
MAKLKSGTDIRGAAVANSPELTYDAAMRIGAGFSCWLADKNGLPITVAVGRDSRVTGENLAQGIMEGLSQGGARVIDTGMSTTPAMFEIVHHPQFNCDAAVMVTASHLPSDRNGFKFILKTGGLTGAELDEIIIQSLGDGRPRSPSAVTERSRVDFIPFYLNKLTDIAKASLGEHAFEGLRVVVDAGNGGGGFYAQWLRSLGADTSGSVNLEPDGTFPAHQPNPENAEAIAALAAAVTESNADVGVIFDADCDRAALVAGDGSPINKERLIALCSAMILRSERGAYIVTDSVVSPQLTSFIERHGGHHRRWKRGYKNVITEAQRLIEEGKNCGLAIETSGHAALRGNRLLDDGMYLATLLLIEAAAAKRNGGSILSLVSDLRLPEAEAETRVKIDSKERRLAVLEEVYAFMKDNADYSVSINEPEGVRCDRADGKAWFLLRASLHDPLLVLNIKAETNAHIEAIKEMLNKYLC